MPLVRACICMHMHARVRFTRPGTNMPQKTFCPQLCALLIDRLVKTNGCRDRQGGIHHSLSKRWEKNGEERTPALDHAQALSANPSPRSGTRWMRSTWQSHHMIDLPRYTLLAPVLHRSRHFARARHVRRHNGARYFGRRRAVPCARRVCRCRTRRTTRRTPMASYAAGEMRPSLLNRGSC